MTSETALSARSATGRASKGDHVYGVIRESILSGGLEPGCPIDKTSLCAQHGMSRFPVTVAVNRLAAEGLVVVAPQHGSFVARIAFDDVVECLMLRGVIEAELASLAAERQPAGLVDALDRQLRYQTAAADAADAAGFYSLDLAFHELILASLSMHHTARILDGLRARLERVRRILGRPPGRNRHTLAAHAAIRDAIATQDPPAAAAAMRQHLDDTTALFRTFAETEPSLFSDAR